MAAHPAFAAPDRSPLLTYERETGGRIGLYAENVLTGAKIAWRADERFVMCSTFKASLAALTLSRVDRRRDRLEEMVAFGAADLMDYAPVAKRNLPLGAMPLGDMCKAAVEYSDNTCANILLARVGGPAALTRFWRSLDDKASRLDHNEPLLNRTPLRGVEDTTTPAAMAGNVRRLIMGDALSPASRDLLTGWMIDCKTGGDRLRAGLPSSLRIGDKTGNNGEDAFGDLAAVWLPTGARLVICAYTRGGSPTPDQVERAFAGIGRMVMQRLA